MVRRPQPAGYAGDGEPDRAADREARVRVADIFDEVEADLRAERAQKLLMRYGAWLVAAAVLVVGMAAAWQVWNWYQLRRDRATAAIYLDAMFAAERPAPDGQHPDAKDAIQGFARAAARGPEGYRTLARLEQAALDARSGNLAGAAALWSEVASDTAADPLLRSLANLLWVNQQLDSGNPERLRERLAPLMLPDNPWHSLAQESMAVLDLREGHVEPAKRTLKSLAQDATAPAGVRERAGALLQRLGS